MVNSEKPIPECYIRGEIKGLFGEVPELSQAIQGCAYRLATTSPRGRTIYRCDNQSASEHNYEEICPQIVGDSTYQE